MKKNIIVRPEAQKDLKKAVTWYNLQFRGLGAEFVLSVDAALESISRSPFLCAKTYKNIRRKLVRRFPYGIFYIARGKNVIVIAVLHAKRDPGVWQIRN